MGTEPGFTNPENVGELADVGVAEAPGGLPPAKVHCSVLARDAIRAAINDYRTRRRLPPWETGFPGCGGGSGCGSGPAND